MELKKIHDCPFCGGKSDLRKTRDSSGYWYCECSKCYARHLAYYKDKNAAIAMWNNRMLNGVKISVE
jgi:Lar family restriction alleviation protein